MTIRTAIPADLDAVAAIEAACFPPAEAAGRASLAWPTRCTPTPPSTARAGPGR